MKLQITAASTALFSTWVFVENLGILFDAGDGVSASLGQKCRKVRNVFVTHADRDHVCGLLQLHQLNASNGQPHIYYPKDCGSFPALREFLAKFDPQSGPATWIGIQHGVEVDLENGFSVKTGNSTHVVQGNLTKALDFVICSTKRILRDEFRGKSGVEIAALRKTLGEDGISESKTEELIGYSGDAPELIPSRWSKVKILLHEATFLESATTRGSHSNLPQVMEAASKLSLEALVLLHFSARYSCGQITGAILSLAEQYKPNFPIFAVLPGQVAVDILNQPPIWQPKNRHDSICH